MQGKWASNFIIALSLSQSRSVITTSELTYAQIVPDVDRHKSQDCTVPDQHEDDSPEAIAMETNLASNVEMNAVRLTLSPIIHPVESHTGHPLTGHPGLGTGPMSGSPPAGICPMSQGAGHFMPYSLTEIPHVHLSYPRISPLNRNPFIHPCSSAPAFFNASPTNSLGPSSPTASFSSISMAPPSSPPQSYPHPSLVCHRYPLTLSLSDDSYFNSSHPTQPQVHPHPTQPPMYPHPYSHAYMYSQPHTNGIREDSQNSDRVVVSNQSVLESLVTVRTSSSSRGSNRHSYSEGETPSLRLPSSSPRQRRNSSGSEQRRRHSHHTYGNSSSVLSADATSLRRHRRRSHDARDERADILESLRVVAARPTSQSQCIPIRVFGPSTPTALTHQQI